MQVLKISDDPEFANVPPITLHFGKLSFRWSTTQRASMRCVYTQCWLLFFSLVTVETDRVANLLHMYLGRELKDVQRSAALYELALFNTEHQVCKQKDGHLNQVRADCKFMFCALTSIPR